MNAPSSMASGQAPSARPFLVRLLGRLRNGLLIQEILDRVARTGLVVYPYFIYSEPPPAGPPPPLPPGFTVRWLAAPDAAEIARINMRPLGEEIIRGQMERYKSMGIFCDGRLAGYAWASLHRFPIPGGSGKALFMLEADEAYLFDLYVAPPFRGRRLGELLMHYLARIDRPRLYGAILAFNSSPLRMKSRYGLKEHEIRLYLHLRIGSLPGIDLRLRRRNPKLKSPRLVRVPPLDRKPSDG